VKETSRQYVFATCLQFRFSPQMSRLKNETNNIYSEFSRYSEWLNDGGNCVRFPAVFRSKCSAEHSYSPSTEVKNSHSYNSLHPPPHAFITGAHLSTVKSLFYVEDKSLFCCKVLTETRKNKALRVELIALILWHIRSELQD
jgi:hypothetical protein